MRRSSLGGIIRVGKGEIAYRRFLPGGREGVMHMRFMLTFRFPNEKGNELAIDGSLGQTIQSILEEINPEAAYFTDMEGARGGYLVLNMDDASQIPAIAEPLFLGLDATVQIHPVMTPEDLGRATPAIDQAAQRYGYGAQQPTAEATPTGGRPEGTAIPMEGVPRDVPPRTEEAPPPRTEGIEEGVGPSRSGEAPPRTTEGVPPREEGVAGDIPPRTEEAAPLGREGARQPEREQEEDKGLIDRARDAIIGEEEEPRRREETDRPDREDRPSGR
jgi:hypothetical protein